MARTWAFVNDAGYDPAELARIAPGLQAQLREDLAPAWAAHGVDCASDRVLPTAMPWPRVWVLGGRMIHLHATAPANNQTDVAYHTHTNVGPVIHVFRDLLELYDIPLSVGVSHELLESVVDPNIDRTATLPDGRVVAVEVCDQLEGTTYFKLDVEVANFNLPSNYGLGSTSAPFDHLGLQPTMFAVLAGGYAQQLVDNVWQRLGAMSAYRADLASRGLGRAATRSAS